MKKNKIKVTLCRSGAGRQPSHRATLVGLGLKKLNQTVEHQDTPALRGMIKKVDYLISVEEV